MFTQQRQRKQLVWVPYLRSLTRTFIAINSDSQHPRHEADERSCIAVLDDDLLPGLVSVLLLVEF